MHSVTETQIAWDNDVTETQIAWDNDVAMNAANPPEQRTVNVPLLRKTLEHITAHPDEWVQASWAEQTPCGTSFCLAGHVVHSQGYDIIWRDGADCCPSCADGPGFATHCMVDGQRRSIENAALHELGLNVEQGYALFDATNTLYDLWSEAANLTNGEIEIPADVKARSGT